MIRKSKTISKKTPLNPAIVEEEIVPEDVSISEIIAETIPDTVVLEEKATVTLKDKPIAVVEESQKIIIIEEVPVIKEIKEEVRHTKDLDEIKRLREKLNNGTISDGEATMLFELLKD